MASIPRPPWSGTPSLVEARELLAAGATSSLDLVEASVARIAELDPEIQAFVAVQSGAAAAAARKRDRERREVGGGGPLHGIPFAVKDLIDVRGMPTRAASALTPAAPAAADAELVRRLRAAGAIPLGKTSTPELASTIHGTPTRNPWDLARSVGGSSAGSAAAVAAGMVPFALGTDTAGSLRLPAAWCGLAALRPRRAEIPRGGVISFAPSFDAVGPIARGVADLGLVWEALAGEAVAPVANYRVGVWSDTEQQGSEAFRKAWRLVLATLGECAASTRPLSPRLPAESERARVVVTLHELLREQRRRGWFPDRAAEYGPDLRGQLEWATRRSEDEVRAAHAVLEQARERIAGILEEVDVVAIPTTLSEAPLLAETSGSGRESREAVALTAFASLGDLACVSVPCRYRSLLPVGVQFAARTERDALAFALAFERGQA